MPNTMAEAFCEEHLMTWTEHGEDFTDWRDGDIFTSSHRMNEAGAISLFHPLEEDHLLIVTVFRDRSWIVQQEPMGGTPPLVGTREDEHRILDLIHRTLEGGQKREPPEFPAYPDAPRSKQRQRKQEKPASPWRRPS